MPSKFFVAPLALIAFVLVACADKPVVPVMKPTGDKVKAASGAGRVPVMTPTGDVNKAVNAPTSQSPPKP